MVTDEQWRELRHQMYDDPEVTMGELRATVERIVSEQVEAAKADQKVISANVGYNLGFTHGTAAAEAAERALVERIEARAYFHEVEGARYRERMELVKRQPTRGGKHPERADAYDLGLNEGRAIISELVARDLRAALARPNAEEGPTCTCKRTQVLHKVGCPVVTPPNSCEYCGVIRNANGICWWCDDNQDDRAAMEVQ